MYSENNINYPATNYDAIGNNMLKFRTLDTLINDYELLWKNTRGDKFDKALELFTVYCGFGKWTTRYWSNHTSMVAEVVALYHGEEGYLKKHKYTLACDIVFLLFQITLRIPQISIDQQGGLAAIFHVIFNKTKINPYTFYNDMSLLQAFNAKNPDFLHTIVQYKSWAEFILRNVRDFPPDLAIEKSGYAHPINPESLKLLMNDQDAWLHSWSYPGERFNECTVHSTFKHKSSLEQGEISFLLYCDFGSSYWIQSETKLKDIFDTAVSSLSYVCLAALLDTALQKQHYAVVFYLFCHAYQLTMPDLSEIRGKIYDQNTLMTKIFEAINKPIDSILLVKIISSGIKPWYSFEHAGDKAYLLLCSKHHLIENFNDNEAVYFDQYEPEINRVYITALFSKNAMAIESLLKTNRLNLIENDKLSYCYNKNQYRDIDCFLYNPNDGVTFTALQAVLIVASDANNDLLLFLLDTLKLLIKHRPDCLLQLDSMDNSVDYYLKKMQARNICTENQAVIGQISGLIKSEHKIYKTFYKILPFICHWHYGPEQIPWDIFSVICAFSFELHPQENNAYEALLIATQKRGRPVFPDLQHLIPLLNQDELIHIFEMLIKKENFYSAVYLFCHANNLQQNTHKNFCSISVLNTIAQLIDKPVSAVWILKIFDDIYSSYELYTSDKKVITHHDYLALYNKMHFIIGWEALEKGFITLFKLDINEALASTLHDKNFTMCPHILKLKREEVNAPDYYLKSVRSTQITALQGLILEATNRWSPIFTLNLIEKLITCDKKLISECDSLGQNIYHYLAPLKKVSHLNDEAKAIIAHISVLVETEHHKQFQCHQKHVFFKKLEINALLPVADDMLRDNDNNKAQQEVNAM